MTVIIYDKFKIEATGHTKDIVCAAVSTLITTLANTLEDRGIKAKSSLKPGEAKIECTPNSEQYITVFELFNFCLIGFLSLEESYSKYVKVIRKDA